ncbi:GmrSD restriction endonuclease domain-containing protein [Bittarella massiliensis (ex Durand et al. 2017)]|uniref:GmrSD restriction endonuclease domain-containing protein n=1 Tax=Bittarella massiliensis (ex Durand et al. 2017) TaxID=1720313 RepID=UPI000946D2F8|nr:DUF262 domain-containing protein [Bittarella massiliensis (ex Durand et al. 2017)]
MPDQLELLSIHTEQKDITLAQLKEDVDANDIITNPDYQRKYVYDDIRASRLIESILLGIPIPVIYLCEEEDGTLSVIDGQQRIVSFVRYLKNEFSLNKLTKLTDINGLYYRDLEKRIQRLLKSKTLKAITINKDSKELKYEIFSRLNLGAIMLKDQEVRNCIYRGNFNNMLKDIAQTNKNLHVLFHDENKRSAYEERILRFFALRNYLELRGTFKWVMSSYMEQHQNDDEILISKLKSQYNTLIDVIQQILGENAFFSLCKDKRKKFNGAVYDSIIIPFSYFPSRVLISHADELRIQINCLKETNSEYQNNTYVGTNAGPRVRGRIEQVMKIISDIVSAEVQPDRYRYFHKSIKEHLFYPGYKCSYCGNIILSLDDCEMDHIIPYAKGGSTTLENVQLLHRSCNRNKKDRIVLGGVNEQDDNSEY